MKSLGGVLLLALMATAPAAAQVPHSPDPHGVWQGTIGALPVRVCFNPRKPDPFGAYYYLSKMVPIPLLNDGHGSSLFSEGWPENAKLPRWSLTRILPDRIEGTWRHQARRLPIRLTRIPTGQLVDLETPCGSMAFQQPRLEGVRTVRSRATKDGLSYTRLTLDHRGHFPGVSIETFELDGDSDATRRINARLREPFLESDEGTWLSCIRSSYDSGPFGGDTNESNEPRLVTAKWLSVMHHWDGYCGGAHPSSSNTPRLFDRTTGREVDLFAWLDSKAIKRERVQGLSEDASSLTPAFRDIVLGSWKADDPECDDVIRTQDYWSAELTRTGMTFVPELVHAVQACGEDFAVPFSKLKPFLSPEGREQIALIEAERRR